MKQDVTKGLNAKTIAYYHLINFFCQVVQTRRLKREDAIKDAVWPTKKLGELYIKIILIFLCNSWSSMQIRKIKQNIRWTEVLATPKMWYAVLPQKKILH